MTEEMYYSELTKPSEKSKSSMVLCIVVCILMAATLYLSFWYTPIESENSLAQRMMYLYVPLVWVSGIAFVLLMLTSVGYLITTQSVWHIRASAMAESGMLFCTVAVISGVLRTKTIQGVWWNADMVLATMLVVWTLLAAYLGLRRYAATIAARKWLAGFGLLACFSVPLIYFQLEHIVPAQTVEVVVRQYVGSGWDILVSLITSMLAFFFLFWYLAQHRVSLDLMEEELELLRQTILGQNWQTTNLLVENQNFVIEEYSFTEHQHNE